MLNGTTGRLKGQKYKQSSVGPSLLFVGWSLLCAGWLLGYGLGRSNGIWVKSALRSMNAPPLSRELPSWRGATSTKSSVYVPWKNEAGGKVVE